MTGHKISCRQNLLTESNVKLYLTSLTPVSAILSHFTSAWSLAFSQGHLHDILVSFTVSVCMIYLCPQFRIETGKPYYIDQVGDVFVSEEV